MSLGLGALDIVKVVRYDEGQAGLGGQAEQLLVQPALLGQAVVLELEEEVALAENVRVLAGERGGELPVVDLERPGDLSVQAGAQADQPFGVPGEVLPVDPGFVVVAVNVRIRDQPAEVEVALPVLGQEHEVVGLGVGLALAVGHRTPGDVRLDAQDRLDLAGGRRLVEGHGAVQRPVIRQRQ